MASLVSYNNTEKILTVNGIDFDLKAEELPITVRNKIGDISLGQGVKLSDYYDGDNNQYKLLNVLDDNNVIVERESILKRILEELKTTSQNELKGMIPNANANVEIDGDTFTKLLLVVMLITKILTGVLILQKVSHAACDLPQKQDRQVELERKISSLEEFLQRTSNLLFQMDAIKVE